jgi:hypothetical protein
MSYASHVNTFREWEAQIEANPLLYAQLDEAIKLEHPELANVALNNIGPGMRARVYALVPLSVRVLDPIRGGDRLSELACDNENGAYVYMFLVPDSVKANNWQLIESAFHLLRPFYPMSEERLNNIMDTIPIDMWHALIYFMQNPPDDWIRIFKPNYALLAYFRDNFKPKTETHISRERAISWVKKSQYYGYMMLPPRWAEDPEFLNNFRRRYPSGFA